MRSQQQAERAEQQRIKNLVLNYDLNDDQHDGEEPAFHYVLSPNCKRTRLVGKGVLNKSLMKRNGDGGQSQRSTSPATEKRDTLSPIDSASAQEIKLRQDSFADETGHIDHPHSQPRQDKSGNSRSKQRARKLQMGDIDWYGDRSRSAPVEAPSMQQASLDDFVKEKKQRGGVQGGKNHVKRIG